MKFKCIKKFTKILEFCKLNFLILFLVAGCSMNTSNLKRSGNNKIVDANKSSASKRQPYQNSQYIRKAKTNIINQNFDDEEEQEISIEYRKMYESMIKEDSAKKKKRDSLGNTNTIKQKSLPQYPENQKANSNKITNTYSSITKNNNSTKAEQNTKTTRNNDSANKKSEADLQKQLMEIRKLLDQTQQELAKSKCKLPQVSQNSKYNSANNQVKHGATCSLPPE